MNKMNCRVIMICQGSKFEEPYEREIAQFVYYGDAEDFVNKAMPKENRDRFRIERI